MLAEEEVKREMEKMQTGESNEPVRLAVFDFDGTCISGNSPLLLVQYMNKRHMLKKSVVVKLAFWGLAYKLRLPQSEAWARHLVFTAFEGKPVEETDEFLYQFYDEVIDPIFKPEIDECMRLHAADGDVVIVISATFEPIVVRAMEKHPFQYQISTRMRTTPEGTYTSEVDGMPVQGEVKVSSVQSFADQTYGRDKWVLDHAYGDHHSDQYVLKAAKHAHAVSPDKPLRNMARDNKWDVLDW